MMTGQQLLNELTKLTSEQLALEVLGQGEDNWVYSILKFEESYVDKGKIVDPEDFDSTKHCTIPCLVLRSYY